MAQTSFPWPGDTGAGGIGDCGPYTANAWSDWYERLFCSNSADECVIPNIGNELVVSGAATPLNIATGAAVVNGKFYNNSIATSLAIATPVALTRIDRVILRVDYALQTVRLALLAGTEGGAAPALTQTDGTVWEVSLAQASIAVGGAITLTDERVFLHHNTDIETAMIEDSAITPVKIANRTRQFMVPAYCYNATTTLPCVLGPAANGWELADAVSCMAIGFCKMPSDYVSGMAVSAIVEGSGAGNVYSDNTVYYGSIGEIRTAHNNAIGPGAVAISGTVLHAIQTVTPNALAAADHLMFRYYRYGADALDTIDGIMYFFGWLVTYTADS